MTGGEDAVDYLKLPTDTYKTALDLPGPPRPHPISVTTAEGALSVSVTDSAPVADLREYYIYCDPPPPAN
ncbi:MAG: hypothetical protein R3B70_26865 [Polyangiaceae bacterium]